MIDRETNGLVKTIEHLKERVAYWVDKCNTQIAKRGALLEQLETARAERDEARAQLAASQPTVEPTIDDLKLAGKIIASTEQIKEGTYDFISYAIRFTDGDAIRLRATSSANVEVTITRYSQNADRAARPYCEHCNTCNYTGDHTCPGKEAADRAARTQGISIEEQCYVLSQQWTLEDAVLNDVRRHMEEAVAEAVAAREKELWQTWLRTCTDEKVVQAVAAELAEYSRTYDTWAKRLAEAEQCHAAELAKAKEEHPACNMTCKRCAALLRRLEQRITALERGITVSNDAMKEGAI